MFKTILWQKIYHHKELVLPFEVRESGGRFSCVYLEYPSVKPAAVFVDFYLFSFQVYALNSPVLTFQYLCRPTP